jgi:polysaccharide deacetylase 2 family uncharacterized protein YibQ
MKRPRKRKIPKKKVLVSAAAGSLLVLALVVSGILLYTPRPSGPPERPPRPEAPAAAGPVIIGEKLLIKGCLFDLGIPRDRVRFDGRSVQVSVDKTPPAEKIRKAFGELGREEGVKMAMRNPTRITLTMDGRDWDIVFTSAAPVKTRARIAVIVDDMGQDMAVARRLSAIQADITFAVMPHEHRTADVARYLHHQGREVLLHQPMEGNGKNPGPVAIYGTTDPLEAVSILEESLELVPQAKGVNNHMGSVVTRNREIMEALFTAMKDRGLFFIDSLTTGSSVCRETAQAVGLPFGARDVFLDNELSDSYISGQIEDLVTVALRRGWAIGICHPHEATVDTLTREIPRLAARGIEVVRVSALVDMPGH